MDNTINFLQTLSTLKADEYNVTVRCTNCGYAGMITMKKGKPFLKSARRCPNCECKGYLDNTSEILTTWGTTTYSNGLVAINNTTGEYFGHQQ